MVRSMVPWMMQQPVPLMTMLMMRLADAATGVADGAAAGWADGAAGGAVMQRPARLTGG